MLGMILSINWSDFALDTIILSENKYNVPQSQIVTIEFLLSIN